jgi:transcriptional regulator with XRE-family HTH domain
MSDNKSFSERLKYYRQRRHISISELASITNLPLGTLRRWESGSVHAIRHWQSLVIVARALDLSQEETSNLLILTNLPTLEQLYNSDHNDKNLISFWFPGDMQQFSIVRNNDTTINNLSVSIENFVSGRNKSIPVLKITLDGRIWRGEYLLPEWNKLPTLQRKALMYLYSNSGKICLKDDILDYVWNSKPYTASEDSLRKIFYRLTKFVEEDAKDPNYIIKIHGGHYVLMNTDKIS